MTPEFQGKLIALAIAAIVTAVQLGVEHVVPWEKLFGRRDAAMAGVAGAIKERRMNMELKEYRDYWRESVEWHLCHLRKSPSLREAIFTLRCIWWFIRPRYLIPGYKERKDLS